MLIREYRALDAECRVRIRKRILNTEGDASQYGAFPFGVKLLLEVSVPRALGCAAVVLRIRPDGGNSCDIPLRFVSSEKGEDLYTSVLDTAALCGECGYGLFYYEYLFVRGVHTLFTNSINNVDFCLSDRSAGLFRLLIYDRDYRTPEWFHGATMYHVFVDRFFCGEGAVTVRQDAELEEDWEGGIPQYAENPGDPLKNNRFFGGNLWGVTQKLGYLASLGVTVLYLSPIFEAYSNHKYDTGDYETVDGMFGGEAALRALIDRAGQYGIRVILDGVFNHTGDDSKYFNRYGRYGTAGAYQSPDSPYRDWYLFRNYPDDYESWWGITILPKLNPASRACRDYFTGEGGIVEKYIRMGIGGWRLDVADELSDDFLDSLRSRAKATDADAVIIGEVWENAVDKVAYGKRRRYLCGGQLDSVMNYPIRAGILSFAREGDAERLYHTLVELYGSYPRAVSDSLMNLLGTHDTERVLTVLGADPADFGAPNRELARKRLRADERETAKRRLLIASALQFTVFGIPSVYYGDEAGVEGYHDPFCRMPYPWGREDGELLAHYRRLGEIRKEPAFDGGEFRILGHGKAWIAYERQKGTNRILILANRSDSPVTLSETGTFTELLGKVSCVTELTAPPDTVKIWKQE